MKALCLLGPALAVCAAPAFASVTVSTPTNNATVASPFWLSATASPCSTQPIASMGYSLDNSASTTIFNGASIGANIIASAGGHVLHVKSWGNLGASCVTDVPIKVSAVAAAAAVPANALASGGLQILKNWQAAYDTGTGSGSSSGTMSLVGSPSVSGTAREFLTTYTNYGGERYSLLFGTDSASTNFVLDTRIYVAGPSSGIANIELDLNQVMPNGQTVIFGFQCDGWSNTWDYTINAGTPQKPVDQWVHTTQSCNPRKWTTNTWHRLQISYSRDNGGNVTYKSVWFDGVEQDINATASSAFALGWGPALLANLQVDGATSTSGSSIVYLDNLIVYRW
jgi:hypothetical protein